MAKIYDALQKAYDSGDRYIDSSGKSLTPEDVDMLGRKQYLDDVKNNLLDLEDVAYREFKVEYFKRYLPLENMLKVFTEFYENSPTISRDINEKEE